MATILSHEIFVLNSERKIVLPGTKMAKVFPMSLCIVLFVYF